MTEQELQQLRIFSSTELHQSALTAMKLERNAAMAVVHHLQEIDRRRLWAEMAYSSLFEYCTKALGYSESQAYRRISALKLIREIPEVENKIINGELNLTTVTQAQTFFRQESKLERRKISLDEKGAVLSAISGKTQKQVEVELAKRSPKIPIPDWEKPISAEQIQIRFAADVELANKLTKLRELIGQKISIDANYNELLHKICDLALEKLEPKKRDASPKRLSDATKICDFKREYIPVETRRAVWDRDESQCTFVDPFGNHRCACRRRLEVDHIIPIAKGGDNSLENLRLLCKAHNQWAAIQEFGSDKMRKYLSEL